MEGAAMACKAILELKKGNSTNKDGHDNAGR